MTKHTALYEEHKRQNGRLVDFHGWKMPLHYDTGIIKEHTTVRSSLGLFDVSHMGDLLIFDSNNDKGLQSLLTNDITNIRTGKAAYTHLTNGDGIIIDDLIITKLTDGGKYFCVPNASMVDVVREWIRGNSAVEVQDISLDVSCIAVQGPKSQDSLGEIFGSDINEIKRFTVKAFDLENKAFVDTDQLSENGLKKAQAIISRTGYTGEEGFEVIIPNSYAPEIWRSLLRLDVGSEIRPVGLGARDTLRLEMGYLLSGQDFNKDRTPLETNCAWVVKWDHDFIGKERLEEQRATKNHQKMIGVCLEGKASARTGARVYLTDSPHEIVGSVSSGNFSPSLGHAIALAYVDRTYYQEGIEVVLEYKGRKLKGVTTKTPFIKKK
jgi:aminomethyltransferase